MRNVLYILIAFVFALTGVTASGQNTKWWKRQVERPNTMPVVVGSTRFDMVLVQGGSYMMGCEIQINGCAVQINWFEIQINGVEYK